MSKSLPGTWGLFYASWYTNYLAESTNERANIATVTALLLLLHRCIRLLAIRFRVPCHRLRIAAPDFSWCFHSFPYFASGQLISSAESAEVSGSHFHANTLMSAKAVDACPLDNYLFLMCRLTFSWRYSQEWGIHCWNISYIIYMSYIA